MAEGSAASAKRRVESRPMRRLAIAVLLIAAAVAGYALLHRDASEEQVTASPAPSAEPPAIASLPPPKPIAPPPNQPAPNDAQGSAATVQAPPPPPSVSAEPAAPSIGAPKPPRPTSPSPATPEGSAAPVPAAEAPASSPTQTRPDARGPAGQVAASPITPGFVVQLGMFTSVENAQALRARLEAQGIPVFLETRVVVGPFRDRAEADAARKRLNALGVAGVLAQRK